MSFHFQFYVSFVVKKNNKNITKINITVNRTEGKGSLKERDNRKKRKNETKIDVIRERDLKK